MSQRFREGGKETRSWSACSSSRRKMVGSRGEHIMKVPVSHMGSLSLSFVFLAGYQK